MLASFTSTDSESQISPQGNPSSIQSGRKPLYDPEGDFHLSATELVRSVVTSLREPSQQMVDAAIYEESTDPRATAKNVWQAMIDVMLAED